MSRPNFLCAALGAVVFYALLAVLFRPFVADDAYIVGRYAQNVIRGHGLVYNVGEYVSALTSPLHAIVLTGIAAVSEKPVSLYRGLATLFPILGWALAIPIYRPRRAEIAVVSLVGLASPFLVLWAGGGLETPILAALLTIFAALLFRVARRNAATTADFLAAGLVAGLAFLTRFDSIIITLPPMLAVALVLWRRPALWVGALLAAAIAGSWLVFSYLYYGDILPTSAYIKLSAYATKPVDNIAALINFLLVSGVGIWAVVALFAPRPERTDLGQAIGRGVVLSCLAFLFYAYTSSGVHMMFSFRFFMPVLMVAAMLLAARAQYLGRALVPLLLVQAVVQVGVAARIQTTGMNVYAITDFGPLGRVWHEYRRTTPKKYGAFMAFLEEDAKHLKAHWAGEGRDEVPHIYMYTGGLGYWLPEFYVFETLASYRHYCGPNLNRVLATTHYVQDMSISPNARVQAVYDEVYATGTATEISRSEFETDKTWILFYKYNQTFDNVTLPSQVGGPC